MGLKLARTILQINAVYVNSSDLIISTKRQKMEARGFSSRSSLPIEAPQSTKKSKLVDFSSITGTCSRDSLGAYQWEHHNHTKGRNVNWFSYACNHMTII